MNDFNGLEVWRGGVNTWECDEMGHLNVRFYVARAMEGLVGLAGAMGLDGAFRPGADATLLVREQHIRFLREARPGAALHMVAGLVSIGEDDARVLQLLIHSTTGELAASFQTTISHVTSREGRAFAWADRTVERALNLMMQVPDRARPRSLALTPVASGASLEAARHMGLASLGVGAFGPQDCDVFGRMRPEVFIGRVSDGVAGLREATGGGERPAGVGGAVLEYRLLHLDWPGAGDRYEIRSGLVGVDQRAQRLIHWMLDPVSGRAWGSAEAVAVSLDLAARKIIPIDEQSRARLSAAIKPGLSL